MRTRESAREGLDKWSVVESEVGNRSIERFSKPKNPAFQTLQCAKTQNPDLAAIQQQILQEVVKPKRQVEKAI